MQGAQSTGSWNRGIGRYTISLAKAIVRNRGAHDVYLALNGAFPQSIQRIRSSFEGVLPQANIRVWNAPTPMAYMDNENQWRRESGELLYETFLYSLSPDFVLVSSLFEGFVDDAATSIKRLSNESLTAVILYDLIPFIYRKPYLENPGPEKWYLEKIEYLKRADLWLAISESSRQEGIEHLDFSSADCINISTDADQCFKKIDISAEQEDQLRQRYGLQRNFLMYTGGIDHRKNIEGLICSYAKLPQELRSKHQLAIVCSVQENSRLMLLALASEAGLKTDELVLTGFVPEEDLIALYNLCKAFIFPSLHEGFGLPALEAMRCGAPVIGANTSSLPEVIGKQEALFNPHSQEAIKHAMEQVLSDQAYRERLIAHAKNQAAKFSWDKTALRALDAMNQISEKKANYKAEQAVVKNRPKLAYVSPLPPERSGISDYSAELLPALSEHYDIEVVVIQDKVTDSWIQENCHIRSVEWFKANGHRFDRVLYHFGNSSFHQHMFELLRSIPGVVVLHDFYLSAVINHMDALGYSPNYFNEALYHSHGYAGLLERDQVKDVADIIWKYPCSLEVIEKSIGTIVHSENSIRLAKFWYSEEKSKLKVIPHLRVKPPNIDVYSARKKLGLSSSAFIVCAFGIMGSHKLNHSLLLAWLDSDLASNKDCYLVFVGANDSGDYGLELSSLISKHPNGKSVHITRWCDQDIYRNYLAVADLGVQLRTLSRGETSGTVLDCMNYGLATIVNANGSMADLPDNAVYKLRDDFDVSELTIALESLWRDKDRRQQIGSQAKKIIFEKHDPVSCAEKYLVAIESSYKVNKPLLNNLYNSIAGISTEHLNDKNLISLSDSIAKSFPISSLKKTLFVDISELIQHDAKSGIQRVVRSILKHWLLDPPCGWRIEPVYATNSNSYRYARQFTCSFLGIKNTKLVDDLIEFQSGDIFFALDFCPQIQIYQKNFYQKLRGQGLLVYFMVYDLLCITQPQNFVQGVHNSFKNWLDVVINSDGAVCISEAVAKDLSRWIEMQRVKHLRPFQIKVNHLGVDVESSTPTFSIPDNAAELIINVKKTPSFVMVGTLEPRKGHAQVLSAFESLWLKEVDINIVIIGKQGWMVEGLVSRLRKHVELGKRLIWLEGISDEYLEKIYAASTCLIAASFGEGFGLPLIEAAQHKLPIIARDISVFREVAGDYAFYFDSSDDLAESIQKWLGLYLIGKHPKSDDMPWLTWEESSDRLMTAIGTPSIKQNQKTVNPSKNTSSY
jgi:glycosyltransferase involved in cell wall biosynthesis